MKINQSPRIAWKITGIQAFPEMPVSGNSSRHIQYLFFKAWILKDKNKKGEKRSASEIFVSYTEDSTIQGLMLIFLPYQVKKFGLPLNQVIQALQLFV